MTRLKYLDPADGQYKLLPVGGGGGGGAEEVVISAGVLPTKSEELWVDTSATAPVTDWSYADNRYLTSGFRNVIRNGDMSIAQRGNGPFSTSTAYTIDGWTIAFSGGTANITKVMAAAGEASPKASVVVSGQSAAGDYCQVLNVIEDVNTLNGKTATISFDAWCSSGTPKVSLELQQIFGTGGTPSATQFTAVGAITLSTTRTRYSITVAIPSVAGASLGTNGNHNLRLAFWFSAGSTYATRASNIGIQNGTFNITDVQLEEGSAATKFERLPIQQQLAWCQRYYYRNAGASASGYSGYSFVGSGWVQATNLNRVGIELPVPMRAVPSVAFTGLIAIESGGPNSFIGTSASSVSSINSSPYGKLFVDFVPVAGINKGYSCFMYANPSTSHYIEFSAEL